MMLLATICDVAITPEVFVCERHQQTLTWSPTGKYILVSLCPTTADGNNNVSKTAAYQFLHLEYVPGASVFKPTQHRQTKEVVLS